MNQFEKYTYVVSSQSGFSLSEALRLWKTKYATYQDFCREVIRHPSMKPFGEFVSEVWDSIEPVTVEMALSQNNTETRRTYFDCLGVERIFKQLEPTLRERKVIKKSRHRWDETLKPWTHEFEDVYELYEIEGSKIFGTRMGRGFEPVFAVRCHCTTTGREYWLYVPIEAATGSRWWNSQQHMAENANFNAIRAIAWTIRIDIDKPERIYRQGDIIVVKEGPQSRAVLPYHLTEEQYLSLMYSET